MSALFVFIATKTSADFVVPVSAPSQAEFMRKVHNAFQGLVGGVTRAGDLKLRPTQDAIANHLLCDGSTLHPKSFPDLFRAIGVTFGGDGVTTFALPDYTGSIEATAPTVTQETQPGGTVSTGGTVDTSAPTGGSSGGNVPSGGRPFRVDESLAPEIDR